jgi:phosphoribosylformimino-5-aminoimidazole carboxamide ribonucleotide (ProFAR) isomerase
MPRYYFHAGCKYLSTASEKDFEAVVIGRALYMGSIKYRNLKNLPCC